MHSQRNCLACQADSDAFKCLDYSLITFRVRCTPSTYKSIVVGLVLLRVLKAIGHTTAECELGNATEELEGLAPAC